MRFFTRTVCQIKLQVGHGGEEVHEEERKREGKGNEGKNSSFTDHPKSFINRPDDARKT